MTTKTKADPTAELAPIKEQLEAAREERSRLGQEYRAWEDELVGLQAELDSLADTDPGQFTGGHPKPKTRAAELQGEIDKRVNGNRWPQILGGADKRIGALEAEHSRAMEANAEQLAHRELHGRGTANAKKWRQIAELIVEADSEYTASWNTHMGIVNTVTGLNGQDLVADPVVAEVRKLAPRLAEVQPPRAVSLVPLTTDDPARVKSKNGGYIRAGANAADIAEGQPQRVEPI